MAGDVLDLGQEPRPDRDAGLAPLGGDLALGIAGDHDGLRGIGGLGGAQHVAEGRDIGAEVAARLAKLSSEARVAVLPQGPLTIPYLA